MYEDQQDQIKTIYSSGEHLLALINDILEISKIESGRIEVMLEATDFTSILNDIEQLFRLRADEKGIAFEIEIIKPITFGVLLDVQKVKQVIINLIGNAIKFTDKGGVMLTVDINSDIEQSLFKNVKSWILALVLQMKT